MIIVRKLFIVCVLLSILFLAISGARTSIAAAMQPTASITETTVTFWVQTMDSCKQAIPGAFYELTGNGLDIPEGPTPGTKLRAVGKGACALQRGNCITVPTGCLSWDIPVPAIGSATYTLTETAASKGYVFCTGGSVCSVPETVTLTIDAAASVTATVTNIYPNGQSIVWPTTGMLYTGQATDPAVPHNSALGTGNCDGDADADDHTSGSEGFSPHCDNDQDRHH